jgi:hypothetical protein
VGIKVGISGKSQLVALCQYLNMGVKKERAKVRMGRTRKQTRRRRRRDFLILISMEGNHQNMWNTPRHENRLNAKVLQEMKQFIAG